MMNFGRIDLRFIHKNGWKALVSEESDDLPLVQIIAVAAVVIVATLLLFKKRDMI